MSRRLSSRTAARRRGAFLIGAALFCAAPLDAQFSPVPRALTPAESVEGAHTIFSPDGANSLTLSLRDGRLHWSASRHGTPIVLPSRLGFTFRRGAPLDSGLRIVDVVRDSSDETFTLPWGEVKRIRDTHRELRVRVEETAAPRRAFVVAARAFADGVAFRYELPEQPGLREFAIREELTEFRMAEDAKAWWIPATVPSPDRQEMLYSSGRISKMDTVHTPLTLELSNGWAAVIHEADLVDWAGMYVYGTSESRTLRTTLARWKDGDAVKGRTPMRSPWRTLQIAEHVTRLAPSVLTLKLNPPSRIEDTRWITPMKYNGIWWGMHVNTMTWGSGPLHGATTANTKRYLDHAAASGFGGTLVEGWNIGWDGDWIRAGDGFSFTQSYPDFDLPAVARYATERGLTLIGHHETATFVENYERQLDSAFALYARLGVRAVKTGYVGDTTSPGGHMHQSQYMVRHYRRVLETAAKYGVAVDMHEPIKDGGERRTWPHMMTREGARGQEFNAWGGEGGNPPEHETILFFTRMLAGPMDFTPGIFNLTVTRSGTNVPRTPLDSRPRTTLAKQLALYVVLYSPLQMAADLPENYADQPAFQFIRDVAVDWDTTRVLSGVIGDHVVVARKAAGRDEWFVGAITDEEARVVEVPLDFLPAGDAWIAEIYADGADADWATNPTSVTLSQQRVSAASRLRIVMAAGGGQAVRLRRAD